MQKSQKRLTPLKDFTHKVEHMSIETSLGHVDLGKEAQEEIERRKDLRLQNLLRSARETDVTVVGVLELLKVVESLGGSPEKAGRRFAEELESTEVKVLEQGFSLIKD